MNRVRELREQRAHLHSQAARLLAKGSLTAEDRDKFDRMMNEVDALKEDIERLERSDAAGADLARTTRPPEGQIGGSAFEEASSERRHRRAFKNFLRHGLLPDHYGFKGISDEDRAIMQEFRDMGVGTGNLGGYFVPQGFVYEVEQALKYYGPMTTVAKMLDTASGQPLPYPTSNDTSIVGEIVAEGAAVSSADVSIGQLMLGAFKFSTRMVKVSLELMQDAAFDMEAFLIENFARRLGRILNTKFTVGVGTTEPMGIITASPVGVGGTSGIAVIGDDNAATPDPTKQVGYLDLVNLEHSIDPIYRPGAAFMMSDPVLKFIQQLKDKYGRPIWVPSVSTSKPDTILGYPYYINNDMAALATGQKTVAFGRLDKYIVRRVKDLMVLRLTERYADFGQLGFLGFARYDGNLLDAGTRPVRLLQQA